MPAVPGPSLAPWPWSSGRPAGLATARADHSVCSVFELAGRDRHGLLAAVLQLLVVNGCEVLSAAVRTDGGGGEGGRGAVLARWQAGGRAREAQPVHCV